MAACTWRWIPCKITELRLDKTLVCGQSFRWKERTPGIWTGVLAGYVWNLRQSDTQLFYQVVLPPHHADNITADKYAGITVKTEPFQITDNTKTVTHAKLAEKHTKKRSKIRTFPIKKEGNDTEMIDKSLDQGATQVLDSDSVVKVSTLTDCHYQNVKLEKDITDTKDTPELEAILQDYFRLDVNLTDLYSTWSHSDPVFKRTATDFTGIRILRQDPVENLFSFICSSNNHISRISGMVERLCQAYGTKVTEYEGEPYFSFPSVKSLSGCDVEDTLRGLGFGYRAKYIGLTAKYIQENHSNRWLMGLRDLPYNDTKSELMKLCGVGAKVADCVCLMSLDKLEAVPVDTHVWQIAARDYMPKLKQAKSLTDKLYAEIGDHFRELWGDKAGWAHTVLFTADLKKFKDKSDTKEKVLKAGPKKAKAKGQKRTKSLDNDGGKKAKKIS